MVSFNIFENISEKFFNNQFLASTVILLVLLILVSIIKIINEYKIKKDKLTLIFLLAAASFLLFNITGAKVYYLPDLFLIFIVIYRLTKLSQKLTYGFIISCSLIIYFIVMSESHMDFEFDNNYIVALKPLAYLIILHIISEIKIVTNLKYILINIIIIYPLLLLFNIFLTWLETGYYFTRPFFLFENNFEIPFLIYSFIALTFIYGIKDIKFFLLLTASVFLTGSRSGLVSYLIISIIYLYYIYGKRGLFFGAVISSILISYFVFIRSGGNFNLSINSIDRFSNLLHVLSIYDYSFAEILKYPAGFGIYQKIPIGVCEKAAIYAEWATGNMHNCDPIMMQSFVARALFQYGIYVLILIPILYLYEIQRVMNLNFAVLLMIPITVASFSVGGYSNGLAFFGLLICIFSFNQNNHFRNLK